MEGELQARPQPLTSSVRSADPHAPALLKCGVDIVGPSNLFTLLGTIPPYWESFKQQFDQRMGDPTTEQGRAILEAASPLAYANRIKNRC